MKAILLLTILTVLIVSCAPAAEPAPEPEPQPQAPTQNAQATGPGVHRMISKTSLSPGEEFVVTLKVKLDEGVSYYILDDTIPSEVEVVSTQGGTVTPSNHFKEAIIQNAQDTDYTITVKAPSTPGTYTFTGEYYFESDSEEPLEITGDSTITVQ